MDDIKFKAAYAESRNGANYFVRHSLARNFQYSDGVLECAESGCYWLLDIIATECCKPLRASGGGLATVKVVVASGKADLSLITVDDQPPIWSRQVDWTDMTAGEWTFLLADEGGRFALILVTEY